jgi:regulator of protease activity HflC (stomatin/prohibitin superfamily)
MFGIQYLKTGPTQYVIHFQNGRKTRSGPGLAFFYYRPASSISVVPLSSVDVPFIFNEMSSDFQPVTIQGQLTYRITDPEAVASILNYTIDTGPDAYTSEDPQKLAQRLVNLVQALVRAEVQGLPLRDVIRSSQEVAGAVLVRLGTNDRQAALGVEVLDLSIQAIQPMPEMQRALEAETREATLQRADSAIYDRRNSAVEQERRIKENELSTEIAVEEKKRQIRETKASADLAVETREQQVRESKLAGQVRLETERKQLVAVRSENARSEADSQAYAVEASLRPLTTLDPHVLEMLSLQNMDPRRMVSLALKEIAQNAGKIGNLNLSPDLMEMLMKENK